VDHGQAAGDLGYSAYYHRLAVAGREGGIIAS
jgi:hypothetical protein